MNVYLTSTPEFSNEKIEDVAKLVLEIPGELKFIKCDPLTEAQFNRLCNRPEDVTQISSLSFEEYFDLIQGYRETAKTPNNKHFTEDDFIIVISSIRHNLNWFSAFNKRNIFIHGVEWDLISDVDSKFGIAYECVENIFQSLINLDIHNYDQEPNIHMSSIGCINDFCREKKQILNKLQSANICQSCYERSVASGVNDLVMTHIVSIMEEIRKEFVIYRRFTREANLEKLRIDEKGDIYIGDRKINMNTLPKVMYICFLKNIEGFPTDQICENEKQFEKIYKIIKKNPDEYAVRRMCCRTITYGNRTEKIRPTFETYRTRIKEALVNVLGDTLTNYYHVNLTEDQNNRNIFRVSLNNDYLEIDPKFLN
jgi:hypothetical protein